MSLLQVGKVNAAVTRSCKDNSSNSLVNLILLGSLHLLSGKLKSPSDNNLFLSIDDISNQFALPQLVIIAYISETCNIHIIITYNTNNTVNHPSERLFIPHLLHRGWCSL